MITNLFTHLGRVIAIDHDGTSLYRFITFGVE
jgi:hypothetical protein